MATAPVQQQEGGYTEPLSGTEIINDLCDIIGQKLSRDCHLRSVDGYAGGYSAEISVKITCYGLDTATVSTKIVHGPAKPEDENTRTVEASIEVPVDTALNLVRQRSGQPVPTMAKDDEGKTTVKRRTYARPETGITKTE